MRSEFEFINNIKSRYSLSKVGDDCAVLPKNAETDLLITSDMLVECVDFRLEWATPEQIGHKALAVSLSDIAAMGGSPTYAMLAIAVGEKLWKTDFLDRFYAGWYELANKFGVELIGGDVSRSTGLFTIDSIVLGEVAKGRAMLRSGAKPGDGIFVTGTLGGAAGGLKLLQDEASPHTKTVDALHEKQVEPIPHLSIGNLLQTRQLTTACIDISDGLSSDLHHLADASGVGAEIYAERLPIEPGLRAHFLAAECLEMALNGGEDFELLFTGDQKTISTAGLPKVTLIGEITANTGRVEMIDGDESRPLEAQGYRHF